ncbi:hypothetical protein BGX38DRAFT_1267882 [Terfezia claveryi]|nr:hypothetical protein BGX38DRAFT_1267882 [Terfezia claveryi]
MRGKLPPLLAIVVGVVTGVYTFQPLLANEAREKQKRLAVPEGKPGLNLEGYGNSEAEQDGVGKPAKAVVMEVNQPTEVEADPDGELWESVVRKR